MWFFHALHRYDTLSGDHTLVRELLPVLEEIVDWHRKGTRFGIHVDTDGLLTQGAPDLPLTWMDAKVGDWVVTPRRGKPVEINALWHNALKLLETWLVRDGRGLLGEGIAREARLCCESFNTRFWNPAVGHLYDIVDGERGDDDACRPNQIIAVAVPFSPLEKSKWEPVVRAVADQLLTPVGLRTLSPHHPDYKPRYFGALRARDAAYHQGTVWPWLLGPFVEAWLLAHPEDTEGARELLRPLLQHVTAGACVGSISEIFDAQPPYTPRGCFAQAWSVAELARIAVRLSEAESEIESGEAERTVG
jgi:predicted glycogen debranching enzyme